MFPCGLQLWSRKDTGSTVCPICLLFLGEFNICQHQWTDSKAGDGRIFGCCFLLRMASVYGSLYPSIFGMYSLSAPTTMTRLRCFPIFSPIPHIKWMRRMIGIARTIHLNVGWAAWYPFQRPAPWRLAFVARVCGKTRRMRGVVFVELIGAWMGNDDGSTFRRGAPR